MSDDGIQLSPQLMQALRAALAQHDPRTSDDGLAMQYLVAAAGMMLSDYNAPDVNKHDVLHEMADFMHHVYDYMEQEKARRKPAQDAFGVWKP
jgi:hypothetical protein